MLVVRRVSPSSLRSYLRHCFQDYIKATYPLVCSLWHESIDMLMSCHLVVLFNVDMLGSDGIWQRYEGSVMCFIATSAHASQGYDLANQTAYLDSILRWGLDWMIKVGRQFIPPKPH